MENHPRTTKPPHWGEAEQMYAQTETTLCFAQVAMWGLINIPGQLFPFCGKYLFVGSFQG